MTTTTPLAKAIGGDELAPWEEQFARWLALQTTRVDKEDEQVVLRLLAGQDLSRGAIKKTKTKLAFKRVYQNSRAEVHEQQLKRAKGRAIAMAPKAMMVLGKAVDALDRAYDKGVDDPDRDMLEVIRATPAITNPFLDRVIPRRTESSTVATQIVVNLTPDQARGLSSPVMVVSAEEVQQLQPGQPAVQEVVSSEPSAPASLGPVAVEVVEVPRAEYPPNRLDYAPQLATDQPLGPHPLPEFYNRPAKPDRTQATDKWMELARLRGIPTE